MEVTEEYYDHRTYGDNSDNDYEWKYSNETLNKIAKKLNENCLSKDRKTGFSDSRYEDFDPSNLDFDYKKCRKYCYREDMGYCNQFSYILCKSCNKILEDEIRSKYNKTRIELHIELDMIRQELKELKEQMQKLMDK